MPRYYTTHQYEPLRAPESWDEDGRRFVVRLTEILDDIYRRYGRLTLKDVSTGFQTVLTTLQSGVSALRTAYQALSGRVDEKLDKASVVNNLTTTEAGCALDARQAAALLLAAHPVGSLYLSVDATSPSTLFGGTWERLKDRFLLAAGDVYMPGATGGEAVHTLTASEMPAHTHALARNATGGSAAFGYNYTANNAAEVAADSGVEPAGGGEPHNNLPPYVAVYMWKRVR